MYSGVGACVCVAVSRMMLSCWAKLGGFNLRGLLVDVMLSAGFCFSRYNGFSHIFLSIYTRLRLLVTQISRRAVVHMDNLDWVSLKKKKKNKCFLERSKHCSFPAICLKKMWLSCASVEPRITSESELRHLLSVTLGLCGSSGSHNDYFCRKSSNKAGIISFLYFGPFTGRVTYHITISQKAHASMLHCFTHSHTVWPYIYLMRSSVCVLATPQWVQHDCIIQSWIIVKTQVNYLNK